MPRAISRWLNSACVVIVLTAHLCAAHDYDIDFGIRGVTSVNGNELKKRENRTLCKAVWFFMEWNVTFSALQRRAEKLNRTATAILESEGKSTPKELLHAGASVPGKVDVVIRNAYAALMANALFRDSVLRDFYVAFESVKWNSENVTFGHRNVMSDGGQITSAGGTFEELMRNFEHCKIGYSTATTSESGHGSTPGDSGSDDESDADEAWEYYSDSEEEATYADIDPNEDGANDVSLAVPDGVSVETEWSLGYLKINRTAFWDKVMSNTHSAIRAMNVTTVSFLPGSKGFVDTHNMWRQDAINVVDMVHKECQAVKKAEANAGHRREACHRLKTIVREVNGNRTLKSHVAFATDNGSEFIDNMSGYRCNASGNLHGGALGIIQNEAYCSENTDWVSMDDRCTVLLSASACPVKKAAVEWLLLRFRSALHYMKLRLDAALSSLMDIEDQMKSGVVKVVDRERQKICEYRKIIRDAEMEISKTKEQHEQLHRSLKEHEGKFSDAVREVSETGKRIDTAIWVGTEALKFTAAGAEPHANFLTSDDNDDAVCLGWRRMPLLEEARQLRYNEQASDASTAETQGRVEGFLHEQQGRLENIAGKVSTALRSVFPSYNTEKFLMCGKGDTFSPPRIAVGDVGGLISALEGVPDSNAMKEVEHALSALKENSAQLERRVNEANMAVSRAVSCASKTSALEKVVVAKTRDAIVEAIKRQKNVLCLTIKGLSLMRRSAASLNRKAQRMSESVAQLRVRTETTEMRMLGVNKHSLGDGGMAVMAHETHENMKNVSDRLMAKVSALSAGVEQLLYEIDAQEKNIKETFTTAIQNVTKTTVVDGAVSVCADENAYNVKGPLKDALNSIVLLSSLADTERLKATLQALQANLDVIKTLRDDVKKHALAAMETAREEAAASTDNACTSLFEQFLHAFRFWN
ncbi:hypothetical protein ERJ75_000490200 [Trypanosoma vivax]|uniref:Uncharacterized protein n=1 Tax=Trypanosoma vivax (strain Y486) TaxID=1055687 RepID=F9WUY3_TRYVY|nr:hypothetical protein ERJ75_000490200 [Trypanosoma vivax]CCD21383.1 hypothetical protein, conserved in T. vivax [Trypanosoma vivax Y486]|eukprot:CCD21383.1 hypothetical protein, conserved in T. vivax [Trypanosoma vivax Y486]